VKNRRTLKITRGSVTRPANTTAYAANDAISDVTGDAHFTYSCPGVESKFTGEIVGARLVSSVAGTTNADFTLLLFSADVADVADNAAMTLTDDEARTFIGSISFTNGNFQTATNNKFQQVATNILFQGSKDSGGSGAIYGQLIADAAYTPASGEVFNVDLMIRSD